MKFGRRAGLKIITLSHEPGTGFAADGYARSTGRIGAICVTYGAGGHNNGQPRGGIVLGASADQMTGVEIAHTPRYKLNPIVVLLNNGGWGIFRPIAKRHDLLALPSWRYAELARLWGGRGFRAETVGQVRRALEEAARSSAFAIIEVLIGSRDLSPVTIKYICTAAKKAQIRNPT